MSLDEALDEWEVHEPDSLVDDPEAPFPHPPGWWAVSQHTGIVAYFGTESDAHRFRMAEVNRAMNG